VGKAHADLTRKEENDETACFMRTRISTTKWMIAGLSTSIAELAKESDGKEATHGSASSSRQKKKLKGSDRKSHELGYFV
jgi:hypothetical protein